MSNPTPNTVMNLEDIATLSGVSRSTVSRVLNDHPNVSARTRRRVMEVVQQYNFKPNPAARALASQRLNVIGILIPHVASEIFADAFLPRLIQIVTSTANQLGYSVTLWLSSVETEEEKFYSMFNPRLADGLVIASAVVDYPFLESLDKFGKPYVFVGRPTAQQSQISYIDTDNEGGAYMMTRHLLEIGRRRIGMIPGRLDLVSSRDRQRGYERALAEWGDDRPVLMGKPGNYMERGAYESMNELLTQDVDGVFVSSDAMALGAIRAIRDAGLRIPEDIAVGGYDDMPFAEVNKPTLTTIRQPLQTLGSRATEVLIQMLNDPDAPPVQEELPVQLMVRASSGG